MTPSFRSLYLLQEFLSLIVYVGYIAVILLIIFSEIHYSSVSITYYASRVVS